MNRDTETLYPVPPTRFPSGTPGQLSCMRAVADGLKRLSRRDLERLVKLVAHEVNEKMRKEATNE